MRGTEAEQELPAGNSDMKVVLLEKHRRLSAVSLSQESHNEKQGERREREGEMLNKHADFRGELIILTLLLQIIFPYY